ncbi:hypothetical protein VNO77_33837 [Canavalia gladiata]|uniref:Uncharacterized protein n=1 Tax=Canavalia gladiata TaxID=3824 RepID=A0AAN9KD90_CANGL
MLLAIEGGGFFSSSALGYSKGLNFLLLGWRSDDKPIRVLPWNQYRLVDQESYPKLQLASKKNRHPSRCASFLCFGRASANLDPPSHPKVGPAKHHDVSSGQLVSNRGKYPSTNVNDDGKRELALKSSLKKQENSEPAIVEDATECEASGGKGSDATECKASGEKGRDATECEASGGKGSDAPCHTERRKVQWTDACGRELVQIREFEPSEDDESSDEFDVGNDKTRSCAIM